MEKIVLIPDSFKGTLSSIEVCEILEKAIRFKYPQSQITSIPVADGGEGSVDAFLQAVGGEKISLTVTGPLFEPISSFYGLIDQGKTAVIEMAACAGLPLVEEQKNPSITTTYGVGELILDAAHRGVKKIILGLGGSATNDGGTGCAAALGIKFYNHQGTPFIPVGGTLQDIERIDRSTLNPILKSIEFITMCDIDNPLYGKEGAAYIFSPQKGANPEMVEFLDQNLKGLALVVEKSLGFSEWNFKGAGSAGGMGYGTRVFLNSKIQMGIQTVLDVTHFDELIDHADVVITGEGRLDSQSLRGKVVIGVARRMKNHPAKLIAVVGEVSEDQSLFLNEGIDEIVVTNYLHLPFSEVKKRAKQDLAFVVKQLVERL